MRSSHLNTWSGPGRSVISYIGGKSQLIDHIVPLIEYAAQAYDLNSYYEWCGGGARMLLNLPITLFETRWYNEADLGLCQLFACLGDRKYIYDLQALLEEWGIGEEVFRRAKHAREHGHLGMVEGAACAFVVAMQSYAASGSSFDTSLVSDKKRARSYSRRIDELDLFYGTLADVKVTHGDCFELLGHGGNDKALVYLDPPYTPTEMASSDHYADRSWTSEDHERLVDLLLQTDMLVALSGYDNLIYQRLEEAGWRKIFLKEVSVSSSTTSRLRSREHIWMSFDIPSTLEEQVSRVDYSGW